MLFKETVAVYCENHTETKNTLNKQNKQTPWSESASELYRPSDRRFSAKKKTLCGNN
jgi:hypothetical protein